jgi:phosphonatase-like hydrolase
MIRMVVFDMAGTTVNEDNVVYKTLREAIGYKGYHISLDQVLAEGAGKEKSEAIRTILKTYAHTEDTQLTSEIYSDFIGLLEKAYETQDVVSMSGAEELFDILKQRNITVVLNTGYDSKTANSLLKILDWIKGIQFDCLITASDVKYNRPDPEMIDLAMDMFGITDSKQVIKLGDSVIDIEEGQNAGCRLSIGITTGAHNYLQLQSANPDYIIDDLMELIPILDELSVDRS